MKKVRYQKNQIFINLFFIALCIIIIAPFILLLSISFSSEADIAYSGYSFIPKNVSFEAYKYILKAPRSLIMAYYTTARFSVITTVLAIILKSMIGYALSVRELKGRKYISFYLYFTMLFSGGMVPSYILITNYLHLDDTLWVYILPALVSPWHIFMIRSFMQAIPYEISESAFIDGADTFQIYGRIIIPLSKPVLATVALFTFLVKWNDWMTSMLYINNNQDLISLQYYLQRIMQDIQLLEQEGAYSLVGDIIDVPTETVRMAMAVLVAGPAMFVFPFFQKYFVKGLTIGSVKG